MREVSATFEDCMPLLVRQLESGGIVRFTAHGKSMLPLLGDSVVELTAAPRLLQKGDMALYRRTDGQFVLHRVMRVSADGSYVMCGDNQYWLESPILHEQVLAKVLRFAQNDAMISVENAVYRRYVRRRIFSRPLRAMAARLFAALRSVSRKKI